MVRFLPDGVLCLNQESESLLACGQKAGVKIENNCGGYGTCGKCRVKVLVGEGNPVTPEEEKFFSKEELAEGWRLACKMIPKSMPGIMEVEVPQEQEQCAEEQREERRKKEKEELCAFYEKEIKQTTDMTKRIGEKGYGVAVDMGTTNVELLLWNLETGACEGQQVARNEQGTYGADVVGRMTYALQSGEHYDTLCDTLQNQIGSMIKNFGKPISQIWIVGNSVMTHFLTRTEITGLAKAPYRNGVRKMRQYSGQQLFGLQDCYVTVFPNIESFAGGDLLGVIAYVQKLEQGKNRNVVLIDIGTNGELAVKKGEQWYVTSTAAGPAFEGASISCGMRAEDGAILGMERDGAYELIVKGGGVPRGICGSGLIEVVSCLAEENIISETGYLHTQKEAQELGCTPALVKRLGTNQNGNYFSFYEKNGKHVALTQQDIRELQMAKAAISAGVNSLLETCGMEARQIEKFYLAGAFGTHLNVEAAIKIGLLPQVEKENILPVGNAALMGASLGLLFPEERACVEQEKNRAIHVTLSENPAFQEQYFDCFSFSGRKG